MSQPWWAAFPAVEAVIRCGTLDHTLRWERGRLVPVDHPDTEGERVLAALGGRRSECLAMVEAWDAHGDDLDVLALGPRFPGETLMVGTGDEDDWVRSLLPGPGGRTGAGRPGGFSRGPGASRPGVRRADRSGPEERARIRRDGLLRLFALGADLQLRLSAAVAAAWSAGGARAADRGSALPSLTAAVAGRLAPAVDRWLGLDPDQVTAAVHQGPGWGTARLDGAGPDLTFSMSLPVGWLARVWAPGLAVTGGHLVVDVLEAAWPRARVLALPRPSAAPVVRDVECHEGHWFAKD